MHPTSERCEAASRNTIQTALKSRDRHSIRFYRCSNVAPFTRHDAERLGSVCQAHRVAKQVIWWDQVPATILTEAHRCEAIVDEDRCAELATEVVADGGPPQLTCSQHASREFEFVTNCPDLHALSPGLLERLWKAESLHHRQLEWARDNQSHSLKEAITRSGERLRELKGMVLEHGPQRSGGTNQGKSQGCFLSPHSRSAYEQQLAQMLPPEIPKSEALRALTRELVRQMGLEYGAAVVMTVAGLALRQSDAGNPMSESVTAWLLNYLETLYADVKESEASSATRQSAHPAGASENSG